MRDCDCGRWLFILLDTLQASFSLYLDNGVCVSPRAQYVEGVVACPVMILLISSQVRSHKSYLLGRDVRITLI